MATKIVDFSWLAELTSLVNPRVVVSTVTLFGLYLLYRWLLPKPLPGIPYNEAATKSLFGDLPAIMAYRRKHGRARPFFSSALVDAKTPIFQIFLAPFSKPFVFLSDFHESQDILLRRTKEIERGDRMNEIFSTVVPQNHIAMRTNDPHFKRNRELLKDLMTPSFLNEVSAPEVYNKTLSLINLWRLKSNIAQGNPFSVRQDILDAALDMICAVAFGIDDSQSAVKQQLDFLTGVKDGVPTLNDNGSISFPRLPTMPEMVALRKLSEHMGAMITSGMPKWAHMWKRLTDKSLRNAIATKDTFISGKIDDAVARLQHDESIRSSMDNMLKREMRTAAREGRRPEFHSAHLHDEIYGYVNGGYDTTSTSIQWTIKLLADNQSVQHRLRSILHDSFPEAHKERRQPSVEELTKANIAYLEATVEEIFRIRPPLSGVAREALVDTTILGRTIPKGTQIMMSSISVGYLFPAAPVPEELRSETSRAKSWGDSWNPDNVHLFVPERWLKKDAKTGVEEFDSQAGPLLAFGMGTRGCFGKRLAYLEMRLVVALLVWNFELQELGGELSSYKAEDSLTTTPVYCYAGLKNLL